MTSIQSLSQGGKQGEIATPATMKRRERERQREEKRMRGERERGREKFVGIGFQSIRMK